MIPTQREYAYLFSLIKRCIKGECILFCDVPKHLFEVFWDIIEKEKLVQLNEFDTGIIPKFRYT